MTSIKDSLPHTFNAQSDIQRVEKDALIAQLDELLERYLHTLDEYEKVRRELAKQLSSGYLSLAQANFHNSSSAIRYGQDCYDERMQAIRKVNVKEPESEIIEGRIRFSTFPANESGKGVKSTEKSTPKEQEDENENKRDYASGDQQQPSETPKTGSTSEKTSAPRTDSREDRESTAESSKVVDPLHWFGILVPPALRTAQSTFISAVEGPIPQLATIARHLRTQEIEIGRVRKQIKKL
ncbi:uncharacterized protein K460DRAFT_419467, partial [Cucurbitaria berberidis CBS 394.84]